MADPALLEQILIEEGIRGVEEPSAVAYGDYLLDQLTDLFGLPSGLIASLVRPSEIALWALVIAIPLGLAWIFRGPLRELLLRYTTPPVETARAEPLPLPQPDARALLEAHLAAGEPARALAALWLLLAGGLSERGLGRFEAEMTNREFVYSVRERAPSWPGLAALAGLARRVDALLYGGEAPSAEGVRRLLAEAEGLLAAAPEIGP